MSIDRTIAAVINDSGSGSDGTIGDEAWFALLCDMIDARWSELTTTLTGNQDALSLTSGGREADVLRCNNASALTIRGILAPAAPVKPAKPLLIISIGAGPVSIANEDANPSAADRIISGCGATIELAAGFGIALLRYDDTSDRWRVALHHQGAPVAFTPTFTGLTVGNSTVTGRYVRRGKKIWFRAGFTLGSTGAVGATLTVNLPFTAADANAVGYALHGAMLDLSTAHYPLRGVPSSTSAAQLCALNASGTYTIFGGVGTTIPFTWATGDILEVSGEYEAA